MLLRKHLQNGRAQAVIVNSGNANACNPDGYEKAEQMCALAADALGIAADDVIVASTGVIGQALPIEPIEKSVGALKDSMTRDGGTYAAEAIMTTDTFPKVATKTLKIGTAKVTINGTTHTLTKNSNDGQYDAITVDTTTNKTVSVETVSGGVRMMMNTVEYYGAAAPSVVETTYYTTVSVV